MAELKTKKTTQSVSAFMGAIADEQKRADAKVIAKMLGRVTGQKPHLWTGGMIGYGKYTYTGSNGKTNEWFAVGFAPRKTNITLYVLPGYEHAPIKDLLAQLGKYKNGKSCLYINSLSDVDIKVLEKICAKGYKMIAGKHITYGKTKISS